MIYNFNTEMIDKNVFFSSQLKYKNSLHKGRKILS